MFIDVLARKALWDVGLDYQHGTGHGIGHFLNVHEVITPFFQVPNQNLIVKRVCTLGFVGTNRNWNVSCDAR